MTDLLEIPQEHLLLEQVQTLVLLEPKGSDDIVEVPVEQLEVLEVLEDNTLLETVQEVVLLTECQQGPPGPPGVPGPAGGQVLQRMAGMDTSALLVVYEDLFGVYRYVSRRLLGDFERLAVVSQKHGLVS